MSWWLRANCSRVVGLEFVVRRRRAAGQGPYNGTPSVHDSGRPGRACVQRRSCSAEGTGADAWRRVLPLIWTVSEPPTVRREYVELRDVGDCLFLLTARSRSSTAAASVIAFTAHDVYHGRHVDRDLARGQVAPHSYQADVSHGGIQRGLKSRSGKTQSCLQELLLAIPHWTPLPAPACARSSSKAKEQ